MTHVESMLQTVYFIFQLIVEAVAINAPNNPTVLLEPLLNAMRNERYNYIKALYIWDLPLTNKEITALVCVSLWNKDTGNLILIACF